MSESLRQRERHMEETCKTIGNRLPIIPGLCLEMIFIRTFPPQNSSGHGKCFTETNGVFFLNKKINCFLYRAWPIPPGIHQWQGLHVGPVGCSPPSASFITLMGCYLQAALSGSPWPRSALFSAHSFHIHPDTQADLTHNQAGREGSRRRG